MCNTRSQRPEFFRRFQFTYLFNQFLQCLNRDIFYFVWKIGLKSNSGRPKHNGPKPSKSDLPFRSISTLECYEIRQLHGKSIS